MLLRGCAHDIKTSWMRHGPQFTEALSHGAPGLSYMRRANHRCRQGGNYEPEA